MPLGCDISCRDCNVTSLSCNIGHATPDPSPPDHGGVRDIRRRAGQVMDAYADELKSEFPTVQSPTMIVALILSLVMWTHPTPKIYVCMPGTNPTGAPSNCEQLHYNVLAKFWIPKP